MSNHQKRLSVPNSWPVERKTDTYTVKAGAGPHGEAGVPLLVLLRDVLGYVDSKKEARYALNQDSILVNGDAISDERRPIGMFDIVAFTEREEYYRVFPDEGGDEYSTKDSLVVDNETKEIVAHFPYEEGALVTAIDGTHSGEIGEIDEITVTAGSGDNTVIVETDDGAFETIEDYVVVIDENFVADEDEDGGDDE